MSLGRIYLSFSQSSFEIFQVSFEDFQSFFIYCLIIIYLLIPRDIYIVADTCMWILTSCQDLAGSTNAKQTFKLSLAFHQHAVQILNTFYLEWLLPWFWSRELWPEYNSSALIYNCDSPFLILSLCDRESFYFLVTIAPRN